MTTAHLTEDRLVELYFTDTPSAQEQQHFGACPECDHRRAQVAHLLDETAQASTEDAEAAFPAERLARQQRQILERIEQVAGPARVIAFPAAPAPGTPATTTHWTSRWVAAAAVAGLLVGVVAGRAGRDVLSVDTQASATRPENRQNPVPGIRPVAASTPLSPDDQFLVEIENALESGHGSSLQALDALTPRAWDR